MIPSNQLCVIFSNLIWLLGCGRKHTVNIFLSLSMLIVIIYTNSVSLGLAALTSDVNFPAGRLAETMFFLLPGVSCQPADLMSSFVFQQGTMGNLSLGYGSHMLPACFWMPGATFTVEVQEWISYFIPHFTGACDYLSMLVLKLNHVSKRGHWKHGARCTHKQQLCDVRDSSWISWKFYSIITMVFFISNLIFVLSFVSCVDGWSVFQMKHLQN